MTEYARRRAAVRKEPVIIRCPVCHARFANMDDLTIHKKDCKTVQP